MILGGRVMILGGRGMMILGGRGMMILGVRGMMILGVRGTSVDSGPRRLKGSEIAQERPCSHRADEALLSPCIIQRTTPSHPSREIGPPRE